VAKPGGTAVDVKQTQEQWNADLRRVGKTMTDRAAKGF